MIAPDKCYPQDCLRSGRWSAGSPPRSSPAAPRPSATCLPDRRAPHPRNRVLPEGEAPCAQRGEQLRDSHPGKWFSLSFWNLLEPNKCTFSPNTVVFTTESAVRSMSFLSPCANRRLGHSRKQPLRTPLPLVVRTTLLPSANVSIAALPRPPLHKTHVRVVTEHCKWQSLQCRIIRG